MINSEFQPNPLSSKKPQHNKGTFALTPIDTIKLHRSTSTLSNTPLKFIMTTSGFSTEQDPQVQAYRHIRAQHLAQLKQQRQQDRVELGLPARESSSEKLRRVCYLPVKKATNSVCQNSTAKPSSNHKFEDSGEETLCGDNEKLSLKEVLVDEVAEDARRMSWLRRQEKKVLVTSWIL